MSLNNHLTCQEITSVEGFEHLRDSWEELFESSAYPSLFCTWDWSWQWWRHLGARDQMNHRMVILVVTDERGAVVAIAPFYYPTRTRSPRFLAPLRILRPFGAPLRCRIENLTEEPILLLRKGFEEQALEAIFSHFRRRRSSPWDLTQVSVMQKQEAVSLSNLWKRGGFHWSRAHYRSLAGQFVALPDSWSEFELTLGKAMRRNIARYPRLLSRDGHDWTIRTAKSPEEVGDAIGVLIHLHHCRSRSERGVRHSDHIPNPQLENCFRESLMALASQERASILLLEVDGVAIAAQAILEYGSTVTFYYSGFDPQWHSYSPITTLSAYIIRDAIARGLTYINLSPGFASWKTRWRTVHPYRVDEFYWIPLFPRQIFATLIRYWKRRTGSRCECGFCVVPVFSKEPEENEKLRSRVSNQPIPVPEG